MSADAAWIQSLPKLSHKEVKLGSYVAVKWDNPDKWFVAVVEEKVIQEQPISIAYVADGTTACLHFAQLTHNEWRLLKGGSNWRDTEKRWLQDKYGKFELLEHARKRRSSQDDGGEKKRRKTDKLRSKKDTSNDMTSSRSSWKQKLAKKKKKQSGFALPQYGRQAAADGYLNRHLNTKSSKMFSGLDLLRDDRPQRAMFGHGDYPPAAQILRQQQNPGVDPCGSKFLILNDSSSGELPSPAISHAFSPGSNLLSEDSPRPMSLTDLYYVRWDVQILDKKTAGAYLFMCPLGGFFTVWLHKAKKISLRLSKVRATDSEGLCFAINGSEHSHDKNASLQFKFTKRRTFQGTVKFGNPKHEDFQITGFHVDNSRNVNKMYKKLKKKAMKGKLDQEVVQRIELKEKLIQGTQDKFSRLRAKILSR